MQNRLRQFRKQRGLTLAEVAARIGTTPQTVSRLETEVMTVSTDWLRKFADLYGVTLADLLESPNRQRVEIIGLGGAGGLVSPSAGEAFAFELAVERPVALRMSTDYGPYCAGDLLIGNRLEGTDLSNALGHDCLAQLQDGPLLLRRLVRGTGDRFTLVPLMPGEDIRYDQPLAWAARLVMRLQLLH